MKAAEIFEGETHGGAVGKAMGNEWKKHLGYTWLGIIFDYPVISQRLMLLG